MDVPMTRRTTSSKPSIGCSRTTRTIPARCTITFISGKRATRRKKPKPRLIGLRISSAGRDSLTHGGSRLAVARYLIQPRIGGVVGVLAKLLGKVPPDSEMWIVTEDVPTFLAFRGPMYMGPIWRLRLAAPQWPR